VSNHGNQKYEVVARRYRPARFAELIGQDQIAAALSSAITQNRVGHAYLFCGARGVGKTSSARIFAKCLNCVNGPTVSPCNDCDNCRAISRGDDIDVLEIDGASNNGVDEIRSLRSNASVRPSRSRFKIYIIDEVQMLSRSAFNALLKTLEEPPEHVKFILCTTDPEKVLVTVRSRCQRFDFVPIRTDQILESLKRICRDENVAAEDDALRVIARRASGSLRDSQSLLEQLIAFGEGTITVQQVQQLLGSADTQHVVQLALALAGSDPATAIRLVDQAIENGVDSGQLAQQVLGFFRDVMALRVGASPDALVQCDGSDVDDAKSIADQLGLETILSIVEVIDNAMVRMQSSLHGRTLLEVAIVRICQMENLDSLADLISKVAHPVGDAVPAEAAVSQTPERRFERAPNLKKKTS
jgi:DNA polymerase-3 subunit gamma/tau